MRAINLNLLNLLSYESLKYLETMKQLAREKKKSGGNFVATLFGISHHRVSI